MNGKLITIVKQILHIIFFLVQQCLSSVQVLAVCLRQAAPVKIDSPAAPWCPAHSKPVTFHYFLPVPM